MKGRQTDRDKQIKKRERREKEVEICTGQRNREIKMIEIDNERETNKRRYIDTERERERDREGEIGTDKRKREKKKKEIDNERDTNKQRYIDKKRGREREKYVQRREKEIYK